MKNLIGLPVRGNRFYQRDREIARISKALIDNNIHLMAPRRVGKTSILWYLFDNRVAGRHYVFVDTESIADASQFYKKLLEVILNDPNIKKSLSNKLKAGVKTTGSKFFRIVKSIKILNTGIEFNHDESTRDYYEEFRNFLIDYCATEDTPLVLLLDEFPQTIENMKKKDADAATLFLLGKRAIRIDPVISQKVRFIYTGSIGLNQVVYSMGASATINDLNPLELEPLTEDEAIDFLRKSLPGKVIHDSVVDILRKSLQWYIPFHIQLIALEILRTCGSQPVVTEEIIENAIEGLLSLRYKSHFEHYYVRLKAHFKGDAFRYADLLLKQLAEKQILTSKDTLELAIACQQEEDYRLIIENLMYEGYIHCDYKQRIYFFNSPILKRWWERFICKL
ncbi:ATP-binding protein [Chitinophaga filiformis]|uniref:ATP-binding protein n=1 Tax=Chitinophaga filiformis TaxID=104663 RepID=UPI001F19EB6D|nr:ATP-binding protein [Chitinophaga filiformis]MCF6404993.1 ATP-binding protein [Chitinophaga filiformis]